MNFTSFYVISLALISIANAYQPSYSRRGVFERLKIVAVSASAFVVSPVSAAEPKYQRPAGSENAAVSAAFQAQADKTNERLRKGGFKLDTEKEQDARLSAALSSFSYDSSVSTKNSKSGSKSKK